MDVNAVAAQTTARDATPALGDELSQFGSDGGFAALLAQSAQQMSQNGLQKISAKTLSLFKTMQPASPPPAPSAPAPIAAQNNGATNPPPAASAAPAQDPSAATNNNPPPAPTSTNSSQAASTSSESNDQSNSDDQQTSAEAAPDASSKTAGANNGSAGQSNKVTQTQTGKATKSDKDSKQTDAKQASEPDPALSQTILAAATVAAPVAVIANPTQTAATPDAGQAAVQVANGDKAAAPQDAKDAAAGQSSGDAAAAAAAALAAATEAAATTAAAADAAANANAAQATPAANAAPQIIQLAATAASPTLLGAANAMAGQNNANDAAPSDPIAALLAKRAKPAEKSALPEHQIVANKASSQTALNVATLASPSLAASTPVKPENLGPTAGTAAQTLNSSQAQSLAQIAGQNSGTITVTSSASAPATGVAPQSAASLVPLAILADAALQAGVQQDSQSFGGFGNNSAQQGNSPTPAGTDKPMAMAGLQISGDPTLAAAPANQALANPAPITGSENAPTEAISQVTATAASSEAPPTAPLTNSVPTPVMASPAGVSNAAPSSASSQSSASNTATPSVPTPPAEQLKVQIEKGLKAGSDTISVQLRPDDLGRVDVKLEVQNGQVKATVTADRPETLQLLKNDASGLQQALQDAGLSTDANALSFQLRGEQQQQQQRQASQNRQGNRAVQAVDLALDDSLAPSGMPMQRARSSGAASGVDINV